MIKIFILMVFLPAIGLAWQFSNHQINDHRYYDSKNKIILNKLMFPAVSSFTFGKVNPHKINSLEPMSFNFFLIGDDQKSIRWAKSNAVYLQKIHALGLITNVKSNARLQIIEQKTGLLFFIVSVDDLPKLLNTHHYPFLVDHGWVKQ